MPPKQTNTLTSFFTKGVKATTETKGPGTTETSETSGTSETTGIPSSKDIGVDADLRTFYASLSPNERIAHTIAATDLGSSYDVRKTHGFTRWLSARPK